MCIILGVVLLAAGCIAVRNAAGSKSAAQSVHMLDFNRDLERNSPDDNYRTTYEIFVYSFCDSNGDGIGDLNGIRSKLDYIQDLGFDAVWLTPVHPSSTYHKYDIDDYYAVDPAFGTMEDYEALLEECHARGIRVYMDLVLNHTSEDHEWFKAASDYLHELPSDWEPDPSYCKYFDYYNFTREPSDGFTNLQDTGWYYESGFWSEMPELDLSSDFVRDEIRYIMDYWLSKGVDGFRLDAVTSYYKNDTAANAEFLRFLAETARSIDPDCYIVGEAWTDRDTIAALYTGGIDSLFDFPFAGPDGIIARTLKGGSAASDFVNEMIWSEETFGNADPDHINAPFYTNHDMDRSAGYYPDDNGQTTKMAYAMDLLMTGNAFAYYGEEIGMTGAGKDENRRAPMYWGDDDPSMCAGPPDMDEVSMKFPCLADQLNDEMSLHRWFKEVIRVRNAFPVIARGLTENAGSLSDSDVAAFYRRSGEYSDALIVMNLRGQTVEKEIGQAAEGYELAAVLNTSEERIEYKGGELVLPGYSIAVFTAEQ